ncbi:hypothetical protein VTO42DRAFT_1116 [Malbranchea cinnamomea]
MRGPNGHHLHPTFYESRDLNFFFIPHTVPLRNDLGIRTDAHRGSLFRFFPGEIVLPDLYDILHAIILQIMIRENVFETNMP